jgi:hypothetical protein
MACEPVAAAPAALHPPHPRSSSVIERRPENRRPNGRVFACLRSSMVAPGSKKLGLQPKSAFPSRWRAPGSIAGVLRGLWERAIWCGRPSARARVGVRALALNFPWRYMFAGGMSNWRQFGQANASLLRSFRRLMLVADDPPGGGFIRGARRDSWRGRRRQSGTRTANGGIIERNAVKPVRRGRQHRMI